MEIGFDVISDLHLSPEDSFNWEGKATSLYCIVAGNVSSDLRTLWQTLAHLSQYYQGIFYSPGYLEYEAADNINFRTEQITEMCSRIPNIALLHHHVIIVDGVAVLGCNGWTMFTSAEEADPQRQNARYEDIAYLRKSVEKLQRHLDVKRIVVVTNAVPRKELYFGEQPENVDDYMTLDYCLPADTEMKITHWIFGTHKKIVDTTINDINYLNNPYYKQKPYWAKRLNITF